MRVLKCDGSALIESASEAGETQRLGVTPNVPARVLKRSTRSIKGFLTGPELLRHADRWNTGHGDGATGHAPAPINYLETVTIGDRVTFRFMDFYEHIFLRLSCDSPPWIDFRPVENS